MSAAVGRDSAIRPFSRCCARAALAINFRPHQPQVCEREQRLQLRYVLSQAPVASRNSRRRVRLPVIPWPSPCYFKPSILSALQVCTKHRAAAQLCRPSIAVVYCQISNRPLTVCRRRLRYFTTDSPSMPLGGSKVPCQPTRTRSNESTK